MLRPLLLAVLCTAALASPVAAAPLLPAGWAQPSAPASQPAKQVSADTSCGPNSVLLFSARGSGDKYGAPFVRNKIGAWTQEAGDVLGKWGWSVRDLQAIYPAPAVPSFTKLAEAALVGGALRGGAGAAAAVALVVKDYRDAATKSWRSVKSELVAAYHRCLSRPILLAGYSQGAILLRYVVPRLQPAILHKIVSVDLIADPTEQAAVDSGLQHPPKLDGRLTVDGIDTWAGAALHAGTGFRQTAYPASLRQRVYQYCVEGDLVCDFTAGNLAPSNVFNEGKIHASYGFALTGVAAAKRLGRFAAAAQPSCRNQLLYAAAAVKEHLDPHGPGYGASPNGGVSIDPVAEGAVCSQGWAVALVSRPNVGPTDGFTLFRARGVRWVEVSQLGGDLAACAIERVPGIHVPASVALTLAHGRLHSGIAGC